MRADLNNPARPKMAALKTQVKTNRRKMMATSSCAWYGTFRQNAPWLPLTAPQSDHEIAGCISDVGVPFSRADLQQPQPALIQKVFEWFAELLMNTTRETVEPAMREAARDVCGEEMADIIPVETRNLMGFYASLRKLLVEVRLPGRRRNLDS